MKRTNTILDRIVRDKLKELKALKKLKDLSALKNSLDKRQTPVRDFYQALSVSPRLSIIAEIKKVSPSEGLIRTNFNHLEIALEYEKSTLVDAISILTESNYFQGRINFIKEVKRLTTVPLLRKDFLFEEYQIYESYLAEADAILLIVKILPKQKLTSLIKLATSLGLHCLVEVHSESELKMAMDAGAKIIGINARNLRTFDLDKKVFKQLAKLVPDGVLKVAESGLSSRDDLDRVRIQGANAVLIGSSIMKSTNIQEKLNLLTGGGDNHV